MHGLSFAVALAVVAATSQAQVAFNASSLPQRHLATCTIADGVDYLGNDIGNAAGASATDCCAKCEAKSGCGAFTWTPYNGGTCWFKSSKGATSANSAAKSSELTTTATCSIESNVDYVGNDIGNTPGATAQDCCAKCSARAGCGAFSWTAYNGGTCWLKSGKGTTATKANVHSSVVGSSPPPSPTCPTVENGIDYIGNDIGSVAGADASECCTKCSQRAGCGAFTWTSFNFGTCWLKSSKGATAAKANVYSSVLGLSPSPTTAAPTATTAAPTPTTAAPTPSTAAPTPAPSTAAPTPTTLAPATVAPPAVTPTPKNTCTTLDSGIDYVGNDIGSVAGSDASVCCFKCSQRADCGAFTWTSYNFGTCWLKSSKGATKVHTGAVSGLVAPHIQTRLRSGEIPLRSVNLGGWLVGEYWMSFTSPAWNNTDGNGGEYVVMQTLGKDQGTKQFEDHRATWITEADIQEIVAAGLNAVRVPVGFWIVNDDPSTVANDITRVYAPGALKYLDTLINEWGVMYNLAVMVSLHAHQGSQNGNDHSAPQTLGTTSWSNSQANVDNSLQFATFIAARYKNSPAFLGMGLMNEPSYPTSYSVLWGYYKEAYRRIRATGNKCVLITSPLLYEQEPPIMMDFMRYPTYYNVWHEYHMYFVWGLENMNETQVMNVAGTYRATHLDNWSGNWIHVGEWSLASPWTAPFTNTTLFKEYAATQLHQLEGAHSGWSFWSWREDHETVGLSGWSLRQMLREGVMTVPKV